MPAIGPDRLDPACNHSLGDATCTRQSGGSGRKGSVHKRCKAGSVRTTQGSREALTLKALCSAAQGCRPLSATLDVRRKSTSNPEWVVQSSGIDVLRNPCMF